LPEQSVTSVYPDATIIAIQADAGSDAYSTGFSWKPVPQPESGR
jgi:hypothetical protein